MNDHPNAPAIKSKDRGIRLMPYCWLASVMLTIAVFFSMPYGYYQLMRFAVCGVSGYCAFRAYNGGKQFLLFLAGAVALLFNPFVPIRFDRDTWAVLDLFAAVLMPIMGRNIREKSDKSQPRNSIL